MSGCPAKKIIAVGAVIAIIALLVPFSVSCSKPPAPTAAFTVSYVSGELLILEEFIAGTAPLTIQFTDQSSGEITSWRWNFGDGPAIEGKDEASRNPVHTYTTTNTGYIVSLTVRGPGGRDQKVEQGIVTVFQCSEAANSELNQARQAIKDCLSAAGKTQLDSTVPIKWDGSRGKVTAGGRDAADYLGVWNTFKAAYDVEAYGGVIISGTDVSWGCIRWNSSAVPQARWEKPIP
jgi:PKD repeat protein